MWSKEAITLMSGKEEEPKREEVESNSLEELYAKENESTFSEPNEMRGVVENNSEMTLWGEVQKKLQNEKMTPMFEVDEYIVWLNKELEDNIVKEKKNSKK